MKTAIALIIAELTLSGGTVIAGTFAFNGETVTVDRCAVVTDASGNVYLPECDRYSLPVCLYEDGNPDGLPCVWTDPDTGNAYVVVSESYR